MRPESKKYYLHQIAKQLGSSYFEQEENLLLLLRDGKLFAFVEDDFFRVTIPKRYWNYQPLLRFSLFSTKGGRGKEFKVSSCEIMRDAYRISLEKYEKDQSSDDCLECLRKMIKFSSISYEDENFSIDTSTENKSIYEHENKTDEELRLELENMFIKRLCDTPAYISRESWLKYLNDNGCVSENGIIIPQDKAKGGRRINAYWIKILIYLIKCISHANQNKRIHELLGVDGSQGNKHVANRLFLWASDVKNANDASIPTLKSIIDKLTDIEGEVVDLNVMFPPTSPNKK